MGKGEALLIVDVQNDFCPGGALEVSGGDEIIPFINRYIDLLKGRGAAVIASRDWHPSVTRHFKEFGGIWPAHCVHGSRGAMFHPELRLTPDCLVFSKGADPERDDYSALKARNGEGTPLSVYLRKEGIRLLHICGLATDYCVRQTVLDALVQGFGVTVLVDAVRGVDLTPGDSNLALAEMKSAGAGLTSIDEIE